MGDTKRPLYILTVAGVINVILNLIFVIYFNLGVVGVASATAISQTISAVCVVVCLMKEKSVVHLDLSKLHINKKSLLQILRIGLPAGFQGILFSFSNVIIQSSVNSFGPVVVAGNSVAQNIEGFVYVSMNAYHQGSLSFTSQNYGAHKFNRIKRTLVDSLLCVIVTGLVLGLLAVFFSKSLLSVYTSNPDVIRAGQHRLLYVCGPYFLCGMMDVMVGSLRGIGYSILPMIVSLIGACGLRIVLIVTVFQLPAFHFVETVYATYPISWALTFLAHIICFIILFRKTSKTMPATI
jgi:putative MATE family efflux protein